MKKIALILLSSTLAACSPSGKPDKANLPTVDELALNPEGNPEKDFLIWQNPRTPIAELFDDET
ncbi:hypothetical protein QVM48_13960, partial [Pseudomonas soli]